MYIAYRSDLVLIAQAVFLLEHGQTYRLMIILSVHALATPASVCNDSSLGYSLIYLMIDELREVGLVPVIS